MSEIPEDIRKKSAELYEEVCAADYEIDGEILIAGALLAERERCAKVAETCDVHSLLWRDSIANAIRSNR